MIISAIRVVQMIDNLTMVGSVHSRGTPTTMDLGVAVGIPLKMTETQMVLDSVEEETTLTETITTIETRQVEEMEVSSVLLTQTMIEETLTETMEPISLIETLEGTPNKVLDLEEIPMIEIMIVTTEGLAITTVVTVIEMEVLCSVQVVEIITTHKDGVGSVVSCLEGITTMTEIGIGVGIMAGMVEIHSWER